MKLYVVHIYQVDSISIFSKHDKAIKEVRDALLIESSIEELQDDLISQGVLQKGDTFDPDTFCGWEEFFSGEYDIEEIELDKSLFDKETP